MDVGNSFEDSIIVRAAAEFHGAVPVTVQLLPSTTTCLTTSYPYPTHTLPARFPHPDRILLIPCS